LPDCEGPRQSGKTTLARAVLPAAHYVSLEDPAQRQLALGDARGFLEQFGSEQVILDEAQHVPELFSYIQGIVDRNDIPGQFILTGSHDFLLLEKISQSLAGRCAIAHLLPFSRRELLGRDAPDPSQLANQSVSSLQTANGSSDTLFGTLFAGGYPRIHDRNIPPQHWLAGYVQTYVQRDVRSIVNVGDLELFTTFVRLCAGRTGQVLNLQSLANDCGIDGKTAKRWLFILATSFVVKLLPPYHRNFNKRLVKSPKLYFLDSGLLCYLLGIRAPEELLAHSARGAIFESWVFSELCKHYFHAGQSPPVYFFRDSNGNEVDILIARGSELIPVELKSGQTVGPGSFRGIDYFRRLTARPDSPAILVYGGDAPTRYQGTAVLSWRQV